MFENKIDYKLKKKYKDEPEEFDKPLNNLRSNNDNSGKFEIHNNVYVVQNKIKKSVKINKKVPNGRVSFLGLSFN